MRIIVACIVAMILIPGAAAMADITPEIAVRVQRDIERYRKGDAVIAVSDESGRPIEGASVRAAQVSRDFLFGCNIYMFDRLETPDLNARYKELFKRVMNYATLPFYWKNFEPEQGNPQYDRTKNIVKWCAENGIATKGHPLVWACHDAGVPKWLPKNDHEEVWRLVEQRIRDIVPRYEGEIGIWDVVNESTHGERFAGKSVLDFTSQPFRWAREVGPGKTLIVNEFDVIGDTTGAGPFYKLVKEMQVAAVPLDAIGIQTHMHGGPYSLRSVLDTLDRYQELGLPIHFTETTVLSGAETSEPERERLQAEYVEEFYRVCFSHPAVKAITWWDFSDAGAWRQVAAGLVRKDMSPKPVYLVLDDLINKEWTTVVEGVTGRDGVYAFRGFAGDYDVTVTFPSGGIEAIRLHVRESRSTRAKVDMDSGT